MTGFNFDVITLFPKAFELINNLGVITKALDKNLIDVKLHDLREYGEGSYRQVDDKPYGGGAGMVLKPEPIYKAYESIRKLPKYLSNGYQLLRLYLLKPLDSKDFQPSIR